MEDPLDRSWVEFTTGMGDENVIIRGPKPPPDKSGLRTAFVALVVVGIGATLIGLIVWSAALLHSGPALVYAPQVVHRVITTDDGRHVDCAVSDSGMSCDWAHAQ